MQSEESRRLLASKLSQLTRLNETLQQYLSELSGLLPGANQLPVSEDMIPSFDSSQPKDPLDTSEHTDDEGKMEVEQLKKQVEVILHSSGQE